MYIRAVNPVGLARALEVRVGEWMARSICGIPGNQTTAPSLTNAGSGAAAIAATLHDGLSIKSTTRLMAPPYGTSSRPGKEVIRHRDTDEVLAKENAFARGQFGNVMSTVSRFSDGVTAIRRGRRLALRKVGPWTSAFGQEQPSRNPLAAPVAVQRSAHTLSGLPLREGRRVAAAMRQNATAITTAVAVASISARRQCPCQNAANRYSPGPSQPAAGIDSRQARAACRPADPATSWQSSQASTRKWGHTSSPDSAPSNPCDDRSAGAYRAAHAKPRAQAARVHGPGCACITAGRTRASRRHTARSGPTAGRRDPPRPCAGSARRASGFRGSAPPHRGIRAPAPCPAPATGLPAA